MSRFTIHHVALAAVVFAACAKPEGVINRVQPNYFEKKFFLGSDFVGVQDDPEFFSRGTLIDVGYGAGQDGLFTNTYAQPVSRVKWQVTETLLIARLAYERIEDTDGKGISKATQNGIVVAAYPITRHFDVAREYNPNTGEQSNVIVENAVDRPWYQREYIRVDWSRNLSTDNYDFDTLSMIGVYGGINYEPLAYDITDLQHVDAPHLDVAKGYLDITNKAFATPGLIDLSYLGWEGVGSFPACYLDADIGGGMAPTTQCSPIELTIRQSFLRVTDNDFEPEDWDGRRFQAFGAFTTDRKGYARNYGMTDTQWHRFISRYNIWDRSHYYADPANMTGAIECYTPTTTPDGRDPHRDENGDGTDDECAQAGRGSVCDTFSQKCTLPYAQRQAKPIVWFYGEDSNLNYFDSSRAAAHDWDVAMRVAVQSARYAECVRTQAGNCQEAYPMYFGQQEDNDAVMALAKEVDDCRQGLITAGATNCEALADSLGAQRGLDAAIIAFAKKPEMVVLCHSPVEANDPAACPSPRLPAGITARDCFAARLVNDREEGGTGEKCAAAVTARAGDLRFNTVNVISAPQTPSPWGIMVDADDPLTGEKIAASINIWSHVNDLASQQLVDTARYIKKELNTADVTEGTYVRDWAEAARNASRGGSQPLMSDDERLDTLAKSLGYKGSLQQFKSNLDGFRSSPTFAQTKQLKTKLQTMRFDARAPAASAAAHNARRVKALGSPTEAALTTPAMLELANLRGNNAALPTGAKLALASPLRGANPNINREMNRRKELAYAARGSCVMNESPAPLGNADMADLLEEKFGAFNAADSKDVQAARAEKMRNYIAQRYNYAVLTHEMGHSFGLRHNFVSSSDPFNYRPQYWQLRTDNGTAAACTGVDPTGACVGGRWQDPINDNERKNLLVMFMHSSVMDYPGELAQDMVGLGAYDFAAARMFYADVTSVAADPTMYAGSNLATGMISKLDNFGGITGITYEVGPPGGTAAIHYTALQQNYKLIRDCTEVADPNIYKPLSWNEAVDGVWHPVFDGMIVKTGAAAPYTQCKTIPVDYINWRQLRAPTVSEGTSQDAVSVVDPYLRVRFPYGFASDNWADTGNLSVFRHDNGADAYELFDWLITTQEMNHIFDNYRRNRNTFSVRSAAGRTKSRYNEKMRDAAKGLGLYANLYRDFAANSGWEFESLWSYFLGSEFADQYLAAGLAFDHFTRQLARPEPGPHELDNGVLRSHNSLASYSSVDINIPNGASGYFRNVSFGGRLVENTLSETNGDYDSEYTLNAGSYYDKAWVPLMMSESEDNFISATLPDFVDARYRSVSMADLFPDGFRRWMGNNLTGDDFIKGPRVEAGSAGSPVLDDEGYPASGIAWTSWWKATPEFCFPSATSMLCGSAPANTLVVDPQVGWETQKFLIAMTMEYLPENAKQKWLAQMGIWELGSDTDPGFANRIELHLPNGKVYIARTYGKETIFGRVVQKGIGARMLEYANGLLQAGYVVDPGDDVDGDGTPDWYTPRLFSGQVRVKYDPTVTGVGPTGNNAPIPNCNATVATECPCSANRACVALDNYAELPFFMRQAMRDYGLADPTMKGIY